MDSVIQMQVSLVRVYIGWGEDAEGEGGAVLVL